MAVPIFMVISGYVYSLSYDSSVFAIGKMYSIKELSCKILRFIIPYSLVWLVEITLKILYLKEPISVGLVAKSFLGGGFGPGTYYTPVMIRIVILAPIVFLFIKKHKKLALICLLLINLIYEVLKYYMGMDADIYRLFVFRYLFIFSYGVWLYTSNTNSKDKYDAIDYILGGIGAIYLLLTQYCGIHIVFINMWESTSVVACLYIIPVLRILIRQCKVHNKFLETLGKASYNIYLVQMLFYWAFFDKLHEIVAYRAWNLLLCFVICISIGMIFFWFERLLTKRVIQFIKNK